MMENTSKNSLIVLFLSGIVLFAFLGLISYLPGFRVLGSFSSQYIPMAPSTSVSFLFLSGALWGYLNSDLRRCFKPAVFILTMVTATFGLLEVLGFYFDMDLNFETRIFSDAGSLNGIPLGRMSPSTGALFFLSGLSLICFFQINNQTDSTTRFFGQAAGFLASTVFATAGVFVLGYLYGTPLLYDKTTIPMALTTAIGFEFFSLATIFSVGNHYFPLCYISDHSIQSHLMRFFLPLIVLIVILQGVITQMIPFFRDVNDAFSAALLAAFYALITGLIVNQASKVVGRKIQLAEGLIIQTKEALQENQWRFNEIIESMSDWVWEIDSQWKYTYCSPKVENVLGYSPEEMLGTSPFDYMPPEQSDYHRKVFEQIVMNKDKIRNLENWNIHKSGKNVCLLTNGVPMLDKNGSLIGFRGVDSDITIRKQMETTLKNNEERLNAFLVATPSPMIIYDDNGGPEYLNDSFTDVFGWSLAELKGRPIPFVPEDQQEITNKMTQELFRTGNRVRFETKRLTKSGGCINVIVTASCIKDDVGHIKNIAVTHTDITDQKQMHEMLKEESDNFKNVYYNAFSAISTIDGDRFIDCNKAFVAMLNASEKSEVMNTHPSALSPEVQPDGKSSFEKANQMISIAFNKGFNNFEWTHKKITGEEFPVDVSLTKINHNGKAVLHCLWKDLSKEKELIENLNRAKDDAEVGAKTKAEFLANMSHEIRTPMNGVIGMIDMLLDTELTDEQHDFAVSAGTSADSLLMLINDILDFSKIEAGKLDIENIAFDLRPTLESLSDIMAIKSFEKGVEFACLIHDRVPCHLKGDPGRLRQILTNLTGNAIKFVEKGEVSISVDLKDETDSTATLLFEVKDTGIGIPQNRLDHLFESFTQADASTTRKYGGTGLGLAISKQLSELMGGQIGVESEEGRGANFWFTVVLEKQEKADARIETIPENLKGIHVLVVDDHAMNRRVFKEFLKSWQCRFGQAENGMQALSKLKDAIEKKDPFHIAILDMQMPGMNGETLGRLIKEDPRLKQTHLVMATSMGQRGDSKRMETLGFAAFITKPVKKAILYDCLRFVLEQPDTGTSQQAAKQIITKYKVEENRGMEMKTRCPYRILLAEDNLMNQKVAKNMLEKMGHQVVIANNGREVVEIFRQTPCDLILMDGQMPIMDGIQAAREIRNIESVSMSERIPIIAVTANAMKGDRERFLSAGMDNYVSKPLKKKKLFDVIEKLDIQKHDASM